MPAPAFWRSPRPTSPAPPSSYPAIPDPDVAYLEIRVRVRVPAFDPQADNEGYRDLFTTFRSFDYDPADPAARVTLEVRWLDLASLSDHAWESPTRTPGTVTGPIDAADRARRADRGAGCGPARPRPISVRRRCGSAPGSA